MSSGLWFYFYLLIQPFWGLVWIIFGFGVMYVCSYFFSSTRAKRTAAIFSGALYVAAPWLWVQVQEFQRQRHELLRAKCDEQIKNPVSRAGESVRAVDGFLDTTNYDELLNSRFHRNVDRIAQKSGGGMVIDTGKYRDHPIFALRHGQTFDSSAFELLKVHKFSYIEIEMKPYEDDYSNGGSLDTRNWKGTKYRRYYLAPLSHPHCFILPVPEGVSRASESYRSAEAAYRSRLAKERPDGICLVMEIVDIPLSQVRLQGYEEGGWMIWYPRFGFVRMPSAIHLNYERVRVMDENGVELGSYMGFDYPNEANSRYQCHNYKGVSQIFGQVIVTDPDRKFLKDKAWYKGSSVQRFHEGIRPTKTVEKNDSR